MGKSLCLWTALLAVGATSPAAAATTHRLSEGDVTSLLPGQPVCKVGMRLPQGIRARKGDRVVYAGQTGSVVEVSAPTVTVHFRVKKRADCEKLRPRSWPSPEGRDAWWSSAQNLEYFLATFNYYGGVMQRIFGGKKTPLQRASPQGLTLMDRALEGVLEAWTALKEDRYDEAFRRWSEIRGPIVRVWLTYRGSPSPKPNELSEAQRQIAALDRRTTALKAGYDIYRAARDATFSTAEDALYAGEIQALRQVLQQLDSLRTQVGRIATREGIAEAPVTVDRAWCLTPDEVRSILGRPSPSDAIRKVGKAGAATVSSFVECAFKVLKYTLSGALLLGEVSAKTVSTEAVKAFAQLRAGTDKVLGGAIGLVHIVSSAISLVGAVQRRDEAAIAEAVYGILSGAWSAMAALVGAGLGPTILGTGILWFYYQNYKLLSQIGATLRAIRSRAILDAVKELVELSSKAALAGKKMALGWVEFVKAGGQASPSPELQQMLADAYLRESEQEAQSLRKGLVGIYQMLTSTARGALGNQKDLLAKFGTQTLGRLYPSVNLLPSQQGALDQLAGEVFAGVQRLATYAAETYGK